MLELRIRGAEEFGVVARRLKEVGDKGLRKEMPAGLQRAAEPTKAKVKAAAAAELPHRGGLAALVAASPVSLRTRGGRNPSVRIVATNAHNIRAMDRGTLQHPVYGNRNVWVTQQVREGWLSQTIEGEALQMRQEMEHVLRDVARKIEGGH